MRYWSEYNMCVYTCTCILQNNKLRAILITGRWHNRRNWYIGSVLLPAAEESNATLFGFVCMFSVMKGCVNLEKINKIDKTSLLYRECTFLELRCTICFERWLQRNIP